MILSRGGRGEEEEKGSTPGGKGGGGGRVIVQQVTRICSPYSTVLYDTCTSTANTLLTEQGPGISTPDRGGGKVRIGEEGERKTEEVDEGGGEGGRERRKERKVFRA